MKKSATDKKHKNKNVELFLCNRNAMKNVNMFPKKHMIIINKSIIPIMVTASGSGLKKYDIFSMLVLFFKLFFLNFIKEFLILIFTQYFIRYQFSKNRQLKNFLYRLYQLKEGNGTN